MSEQTLKKRPSNKRDWARINYLHFALLTLGLIGLGYIDGDIYAREDTPPGWLFFTASVYLIIGSGILLSQMCRVEKRALLHVFAWSCVAAGSVFFAVADRVSWFVLVPVGLGAVVGAIRTWKGMDDYV